MVGGFDDHYICVEDGCEFAFIIGSIEEMNVHKCVETCNSSYENRIHSVYSVCTECNNDAFFWIVDGMGHC